MENHQNILDATEYILMAFKNINNYNEFLEYKEELIKAISDIRSAILNMIQINKTISINSYDSKDNYINTDNNNKENNSYLSSMLGLKFNYDPYFKESQLRNLTQNDENIKNNLINNPNYATNIINQNSLTIENNKNNIGYKNSIRNKFKTNNNIINKIDSNNIDKFYSNNNNNNFNDNNYSQKKQKSKKEKISLIADIIMKINNEDYIFEILTKLFGDDLTDRLMSSDVSDELLETIQNAIKEIEFSKKKEKINQKNMKNDEIEDKPKKFPDDILMSTKFRHNIKRSQSSKKCNIGLIKKDNMYREFNFVKSLRRKNQVNQMPVKNKILNKSKSMKKEKPFINATNPYGNYFDAPLQNGGYSKLNQYKNSINE